MKPNQTAVKLSLNKAVVTVLTQDKMINYGGKNGLDNNFATETKTTTTYTLNACGSCGNECTTSLAETCITCFSSF